MKGLPFFIMGESMGGAVTLKIHLKEPSKWDGVILVAPMCKVSSFSFFVFCLVFTSKLCFRVYMFLSISIAAQTSDNVGFLG